MNLKLSILVVILSAIPAIGFASGSTGDYGSNRQVKEVDPAYERGKSIFTGRSKQYKKYKFCMVNGSTQETSKLSRKTLKTFKGSNYQALSESIVKCDEPNKPITSVVSQDDLSLLLYYVNKRYKLNIKN